MVFSLIPKAGKVLSNNLDDFQISTFHMSKRVDQDLKKVRIVTSVNSKDSTRIAYLKEFLETKLKLETTHFKEGGAGNKILNMIENRAEIYFRNKYISKWDLIAGEAILQAYGGRLFTLNNGLP